jgi:hypothetical protein
VVVALIVANYVPLLNTHVDQDNCVFGPVSNEQYRGYLSRASSRLTFSFYSDARPLALKLYELFEELSRNEMAVYPRLAIMHAVLRAIGAEYRNTNGNDISEGPSDPYVKALSQSATVSFNYVLDVNRLRIFWPWPREAWIIGNLASPQYQEQARRLYAKKRGDIAFIVNGPSLKDSPFGHDLKPEGSCPLIPGLDLADRFSLKAE